MLAEHLSDLEEVMQYLPDVEEGDDKNLEDKNIHTQPEDGVQLISAKCRPLLVVPIHSFHRSPKIGHEKRGPKPPFLSIQLFAQKRAPMPMVMFITGSSLVSEFKFN